MANIILHLDNGDTITLTKDSDHEALLNHYKNRLITTLTITLNDFTESIYETYALDEDSLGALDNLLYYDNIEEVAINLDDTHDLDCFKNPRNQGVSRFQSGEELVNSVGK